MVLLRACLVPISIAGALSASAAAQPGAVPPDSEIFRVQQRQAAAWNDHDIDAYAALFAPDADVVNVLGWHWRSRDELRQKLGRAFRSVFAQSHMTIGEVSVEFLRRDVAVSHVRWTMTGALSPTGSEVDVPRQGIQTQVLVRRGGVWRITHFHNTNSVPEADFPPPR